MVSNKSINQYDEFIPDIQGQWIIDPVVTIMHWYYALSYPLAGEAPGVRKEMKDVTTKLGEAAQLSCQIVGRPLPDIKWFRFGKELVQSRKYKMSSDGRTHTLTVMTEEQEDEGVYTCVATNEVGEVESSSKLLLQATPQFHPGYPLKEKYYGAVGSTLRIHVMYIGRPVPAITWFHGQKLLQNSENITIENTEHYTHLVMKNVQRKTHAGKYKVQLSNVLGTVDTMLDVEIQGILFSFSVVFLL